MPLRPGRLLRHRTLIRNRRRAETPASHVGWERRALAPEVWSAPSSSPRSHTRAAEDWISEHAGEGDIVTRPTFLWPRASRLRWDALTVHVEHRILQSLLEVLGNTPPDGLIANRGIRNPAEKLATAIPAQLRRVARRVCRSCRLMPRLDLVHLANESFENCKCVSRFLAPRAKLPDAARRLVQLSAVMLCR
jgi:hypothetical protein